MIEFLRKEFEETRRNPPSTILLPQPVPTGIDLQTLDGKNASRTGSLTPNSLTSAPIKKLTECLLNPPTYSGKRNKLHSFLNQLKNKLNSNINCYPTPNSQLYYIISRLTRDAAETVYPFRPNTVKEVVVILEAFYSNPNQIITIQRKLNRITQGSKNLPLYFTKFYYYTKETK